MALAGLPDGVFPTMITPFTADGAIDWPRVDGMSFFALCGVVFSFSMRGVLRGQR
jgi:hypothetical protein